MRALSLEVRYAGLLNRDGHLVNTRCVLSNGTRNGAGEQTRGSGRRAADADARWPGDRHQDARMWPWQVLCNAHIWHRIPKCGSEATTTVAYRRTRRHKEWGGSKNTTERSQSGGRRCVGGEHDMRVQMKHRVHQFNSYWSWKCYAQSCGSHSTGRSSNAASARGKKNASTRDRTRDLKIADQCE